MSDPKTCARCGAQLESGDELCPRCLLALGRPPDPPEGSAGTASATQRRKKRAAPKLEEIAARFPELEIEALIGEGGMGAVYKARQPKIGRTVALKVLALDPGDDPTFAERFRREAMVLARLDHVNVVKLYDFGARDGLFYLVLEFVDGTNLRSVMKQGLLTPKHALGIVPKICEALQFAHDEGIVHRDIKPENVLIDAKGRVKIADFGLAKIVDADPHDVSLTEIGQVMGTPHYMAPEQLRGAADVDHRADIYSLGVVFYEMLTGELPRGKFDLPSKHVHVDVRLDEIVLKSLERAPERRYQHAIEVKTDVESVGTDAPKAPTESLLVGIAVKARRAKSAGDTERASSATSTELPATVYPNRPWHYFFTFVFLWLIAAWAFNGGLGYFIGAMVLGAAAFWSLMEREVKMQPELETALRSESRGAISARHLTALVLLACGLGALFLGHVAVFDDLAINYRSGPSNPRAVQAAFGLENELLPALQSRVSLTWRSDPTRLEFTRQQLDELDREGLFHQPWLLVLALGLCIATVAVFCSRWGDLAAWRGWRIPMRVTGSLFGSLLLLHGMCALIHFAQHDTSPFVRVLGTGSGANGTGRLASPRSCEDLAHFLRIELIKRGYVTTSTDVWSYRERGSSEPERQLWVSFADPASVFDRWRLTWSGPRRVLPHAVFVLRTEGENGTTIVEGDLGDVRQDSPERREWTEWFSSLIG